MSQLITQWAQSGEQQLTLQEEEGTITLQRHVTTLLLSAQLTEKQPDTSQLQNWMRLGAASLSHFPGALAIAPESGTLWLLRTLPTGCDTQQLSDDLELLLNQRDTWRAVVGRLVKPAIKPITTSLRPQLY